MTFSQLAFIEKPDYCYMIKFQALDISVFLELYSVYYPLLLIVALLLVLVMIGTVSLCLSSKSIKRPKKVYII